MTEIDDPAKQLEKQSKSPDQLFDPRQIAIQVCGTLLSTVAPGWSSGLSLLGFVQGYYSSQQTEARLRLLCESIQLRLEELSAEYSGRFAELDLRLGSSADRDRAIARAMLETAVSADAASVESFGTAIAIQTVIEPTTWGEVNSLIADLARLNRDDLRSLEVLYSRQATYVEDPRSGSHEFHVCFRDVMTAAKAAGFSPEQFYGHCGRLFGFGLAIHINQNTSFEGPDEICFGMTTRGLTLGKLLGFEQAAP